MLNRICRLCQNTALWHHPTVKKGENQKAYTYQYGLGHEEWLGRSEWVLSGYPGLEGEWRYAHIQGLGTRKRKYVGEDVRVLFYTKKAGEPAFAVALLDETHVIDEDEAHWAAEQYKKNNWLSIMHEEVKKIGGDTAGLPPISCNFDQAPWKSPFNLINVRFRPNALHFFERHEIIDIKSFRYGKSLFWDGVLPEKVAALLPLPVPQAKHGGGLREKDELARFSEAIRTRRSISGKQFLPRQAPIQNALALQLNDLFAPQGGRVTCEDECVDVKLVMKNCKAIFFEIKPDDSARRSIRLALGQLMEYAHYPNRNRAICFVIVGDTEDTDNDRDYIAYLNKRYSLPLLYFYWNSSKNCLSDQQIQQLAQIHAEDSAV